MQLVNDEDLGISPAVVLELEYLHDTRRIAVGGNTVVQGLAAQLGLHVCDLPFPAVIESALGQRWTRDPASRARPATHSVSTHLTAPSVAFARYPSARRASASFPAVWTSPLNRRLVGLSGRIEFVILRTGRSPPVASDSTSQ